MDILRNTQGRVFVSTNQLDRFKYYGAMSVGPIEKTLPAKEAVFTIDSKGNVIKIADIKDHNVQPSTASLSGYIPINSASSLEKIINKSNVNIQIHYGTCSNPSDFNTFDSALILRGVNLSSYSISEPSTLVPNRAIVQESGNITIEESYRIFTPKFQRVFGEVGMMTMLGVGFADANYCSIINKNLDILIAMYNAGSFMRFSYSFDNGITWGTHPELFGAHTLGPTSCAFKIVENKMYWAHVYGTDAYISVVDIDTIISESPAIPTTLFTYPQYSAIRDMSATKKYLWCVGGNAASFMVRIDLSDYTKEILDDDANFAGSIANAVDALHDNFVVVVGENDNFAIYQDGEFYLSSIGIDSMAFLSDVKVFSEQHWVVASDMGLYITTDGGINWKKTFSVINKCKFDFYDNLVGYAANSEGVYRTVDGGNTWYQTESSTIWTGVNRFVADKRNPNNLFFLETFYIYSSLQ